MKHYLFVALLISGVVGCKKNAEPAPSLVGTWEWVSSTSIPTPKGSVRVTVGSRVIVPGSAIVTFTDDAKVKVVDFGVSAPLGSYTFDGTTLKCPGTRLPDAQVTTLTDTFMTCVSTSEDALATYVTTDGYKRQ